MGEEEQKTPAEARRPQVARDNGMPGEIHSRAHVAELSRLDADTAEAICRSKAQAEEAEQLAEAMRLSKAEAEAAAAVAEEWTCPRCTFSNKPGDACEMCELPRPRQAQESAVSVPQIHLPPARPESSKPAVAASPKDVAGDSPEEDNECVICMVKPRTHACIPCGHKRLCDGTGEDCQPHSETMEQGCPECRQAVTSIIRIY